MNCVKHIDDQYFATYTVDITVQAIAFGFAHVEVDLNSHLMILIQISH